MANPSKIDTTNALTITELIPNIKQCLRVQQPCFLWAGPGIGKSSVVSALAKEMGGISVDLRLSQMAPTDIIGIPFYNKESNTMSWAPPELLPSEEFAKEYKIVILFLDEMNSAAPAVQAAAYQLVLDRRSGTYTLPKNTVIIAAGNREGDRGVTYKMPSPLANRFAHFELKADFDSWLNWAIKSNVHADVVAYLTTNKHELYEFDATSAEKAFPTPRSWEFVSNLLTTDKADGPLSDTLIRSLVSAAVGGGTAVKYMAYLKVGRDLPNPSDVISGKVKEIKTTEISAHYQLIISMLYEMRDFWFNNTAPTGTFNKVGTTNFEKRNWNSPALQKQWVEMLDNVFNFIMNNFSTEVSIMAMKMAIGNYQLHQSTDMTKLKTWTKVAEKYFRYFKDLS